MALAHALIIPLNVLNVVEINYESQQIWREPPFVMDAKYYLKGSDPARTHNPIKKLLGDMVLLHAEQGALFFPLLPEPATAHIPEAVGTGLAPVRVPTAHITRTVQLKDQRYPGKMASPPAVHLYHLSPDLSPAVLTARLRAILDLAEQCLPERPEPACRGMRLDQDTINASGQLLAANLVLCPKPHIGANVFDVVDADRQCLKDPRVCHIIGNAAQFQRPEVIRAASLADLVFLLSFL